MFFRVIIGAVLLLSSTLVGALGRSPETIVLETSDLVLQMINENQDRIRNDPQFVHDFVDQHIIPVVNLTKMGKLILAYHWRSATPEQRERFLVEFKDMLIRSYARQIADYGHAKVKVLPSRNESSSGKYQNVDTELDLDDGEPLRVSYVFYQSKDEWKMIDLIVEGVSLIKSFNTSFTQEVDQTSLNALIERLATTNIQKETDRVAQE